MEHGEISSESKEKKSWNYYYYIDDEELTRIFRYSRSAEMNFHRLAGPRNVSVDLK